jgi:hypothetical protein
MRLAAMKIHYSSGLFLAGLMAWAGGSGGGCSSIRHQAPMTDPVGPIYAGPNVFKNAEGYLEVHSKTELNNDGGIDYYYHTSYIVCTPQGTRVRSIANHAGLTDEAPALTRLPVGNYVVYAQAEGYGTIQVPVRIEGSRVTAIFLERAGVPLTTTLPVDEAVRLPDGRIIGRKASNGKAH